jgi:hypothetical protein
MDGSYKHIELHVCWELGLRGIAMNWFLAIYKRGIWLLRFVRKKLLQGIELFPNLLNVENFSESHEYVVAL